MTLANEVADGEIQTHQASNNGRVLAISTGEQENERVTLILCNQLSPFMEGVCLAIRCCYEDAAVLSH